MALKRRGPKFLVITLVSPLLYMVAFGWGLGRGMSLNGTSYLEFVIPGIIALTAMNTSFNGAGNRLNVDRLFYKSFDECLMAPIGLTSLLMGKALIGVVRGLISSVAFLIVALIIAPSMHIGPLFLVGLILTCLTFSFLGVLAALLARSHEDMATFGSLILIPMTFLGATFFSLSQVPVGLEYALYISASNSRQPVSEGDGIGPALALGVLSRAHGIFCVILMGRHAGFEESQRLAAWNAEPGGYNSHF